MSGAGRQAARLGALLAPLLAVAAPGLAAAAPRPAAQAPAASEPREVRSRLTRGSPRLGEPFDWEIELRHPPEETWSLPSRLELPPFQATAQGCRRAAAGADVLTTCSVRLSLFELGGHDLPALRLEGAAPGGPQVLEVPGPRVTATGVIDPKAPEDQLTLRGPAPPVPLLLPTWRPVWIALGAVAALALLWLAWRAWRRRSTRADAPSPPMPPDERLARRLDALAAERLPEQGRGQEFFFRLSEAVREYLGAITGVNALDLTTGELLAALAAAGDPRLDLAALRAFSEEADLVKFARLAVGGRECDAGLAFARDLLARTERGRGEGPP